jgi:hypothetical protein
MWDAQPMDQTLEMMKAAIQMAQFVTDHVDNAAAQRLEVKMWRQCAGKEYATICAALAATVARLRQDFMEHSDSDEAAANMAAGAVFVLARGIWEQIDIQALQWQ